MEQRLLGVKFAQPLTSWKSPCPAGISIAALPAPFELPGESTRRRNARGSTTTSRSIVRRYRLCSSFVMIMFTGARQQSATQVSHETSAITRVTLGSADPRSLRRLFVLRECADARVCRQVLRSLVATGEANVRRRPAITRAFHPRSNHVLE